MYFVIVRPVIRFFTRKAFLRREITFLRKIVIEIGFLSVLQDQLLKIRDIVLLIKRGERRNEESVWWSKSYNVEGQSVGIKQCC